MINSNDILKVEQDKKGSTFKIAWQLTKWCNYSCPYCITHSDKITHREESQELIEHYVQKIHELIETKILKLPDVEAIEMLFIGGEVTYYDLERVLSIIGPSYLNRLSITTNFSRDNDYFVSLNKFCNQNDIRLHLTLSYHERGGGQEEQDEFVEKMLDLKRRGVRTLTAATVINESNLEHKMQFIHRMEENGITLSIQRERRASGLAVLPIDVSNYIQKHYKEDLNDKHVKVTLKDGQTCSFVDRHSFLSALNDEGLKTQGMKCTAGINSIRIKCDGIVRRGPCKYLQDTLTLGTLEDINSIELPTQMITCELGQDKICTLCSGVTIERQ